MTNMPLESLWKGSSTLAPRISEESLSCTLQADCRPQHKLSLLFLLSLYQIVLVHYGNLTGE